MTLQTWSPEMVALAKAHAVDRRQLELDGLLLGDVFIALAATDHGWQGCDCDQCALTRRVAQRIGRL